MYLQLRKLEYIYPILIEKFHLLQKQRGKRTEMWSVKQDELS